MIDWERVKELRGEIGDDDFAEVAAMFLEEADEAVGRLVPGLTANAMEADLHFLKGCGPEPWLSGPVGPVPRRRTSRRLGGYNRQSGRSTLHIFRVQGGVSGGNGAGLCGLTVQISGLFSM